MREKMQVTELCLPMIALIAPDIKGIEYERTLVELNKAVSLISNDRVFVDLMIAEKIPAFFDAISFHEDFEVKYSIVLKEIPDYALWNLAKRKQEYRKFGISCLRPIIISIGNYTNQDELDFINSPEWLDQIKSTGFLFIPCCIEDNLKAESNSYQYKVEDLSFERIFEKYCIDVRDYESIDTGEQLLLDHPAALTIEIEI